MVSSIVNLIIATLITAPLGLAFPSVVTDQVLHRRGEIFYQAQGDSYAAGLGAGLYMSRASRCQQYTESYPNLLNAIINDGESISLENHQGCAGATAEEIIKNQPIDPAANLITVSIGLEHINFANVINDCVYKFNGRKSGDCDTTMSSTMDRLESTLADEARKTIENGLEGDRVPDFQLFLVGLPRFWNAETDQCDQVSWNYWQEPLLLHSGGEKMTKERRRKMNDWILRVNDILGGVVETFRKEKETRVHFVNYDAAFEGHRFCEDMYIEPQRNDTVRPEAYLYQYQTPRGHPWRLNDMVAAVGPAVDWVRAVPAAREEYPVLKVSEFYASQPIDLTRPFHDTIPTFMSKIFHPTPSGHWRIAAEIKAAIDAANRPIPLIGPNGPTGPNGLIDTEAMCGDELSRNFPKFFVLEDGRKSAREILQRFSDQACRGVCDAVPGIPDHLIEWQPSETTDGCEYAAKIGPAQELYFYASHAGDNCREAAKIMIDQCMTLKDELARLRSSGSINGPNPAEFYSIGVRPMNGEGSTHAAFPPNVDHLPYMQLSCMSWPRLLFIRKYTIQTSNWDDGDEAKTVFDWMKERVAPTISKRRFKPSTSFHFHSGGNADHKIEFLTPIETAISPEQALDEYWNLEEGSFRCGNNRYRDIPVWKDGEYDLDSGHLPGQVVNTGGNDH